MQCFSGLDPESPSLIEKGDSGSEAGEAIPEKEGDSGSEAGEAVAEE